MEHQYWKPVILKKNKDNKSRKQYATTINVFNKLDDDNPEAPKIISHSIKMQIQQARMAKNLTQKQLAQQTNLTVNIISQYESGKTIPDKSVLLKLSRYLGVKLKS